MVSSINIFGKDLPLYGLFCTLGMIVAALIGMLLCKKRKLEIFDLVGSAVYAFIGGMLGSKLLFIITSLKTIIENNIPFESLIKGGFVFYGGLIGGALGLFIYVKQFKMTFPPFLDIYAVCLPLGHAIGRIGCFFGGCCYGMELHSPISVVYHDPKHYNPAQIPLDTPLLPVQLIEAAVLLIFFVIMLILFLKTKTRMLPIIYIFMYTVARFVLEFFRGDKVRGGVLGISTSQIISLVI